MYEVELKANLKDTNKVIRLLKELSPKIEKVIYHDVYFDTLKEKFSKSEKELRVRKVINGSTRILLTYKGKPFDKKSKSKPEFEVTVDDYEKIFSIIKSLGFYISISFSKKCTNFYFSFNNQKVVATLVTISEISSKFIEIETLVDKKNKIKVAMENLHNLLDYLKIEREDLNSEYYSELVRKKRKKISNM